MRNEPRIAASVHIRRPKVGVLARQTQGVRIFAVGEWRPRGKHLYDKVFRNFVDAFRAFSVCRQIRTGESLPPGGRWHAKRDGRSLRDFEI